MTSNQYMNLCTVDDCQWCGTMLNKNVDLYPHRDGWLVTGYNERQWLSRHCSKCGYDWSLNKLGVPRQ